MATIVIAGANQGLGYALVEQLLRDGHAVAALDCQVDHLESLQRAFPRLLFRQADVRQDKAVGEAIAELCIEPVSYTHLDVYKRQRLCRRI